MASTSVVYGVSLALHGALAVIVVGMREPTRTETVAISMAESKKKEQEKPPEPAKMTESPPEPKSEAPRPRRAAPAPKADAPPPEAAPKAAASKVLDALPELGISMDNGGGGPGGIAIPQGGGAAPAPAPSLVAAPPPKVLAPKPADACSDPVVKPKLKSLSQPTPTTAAREANVSGRVRVEVSVSADGSVTGVRLLAGLGYGLDEISLEAARHASFEPATRCGKAVAATIVVALRFQTQ